MQSCRNISKQILTKVGPDRLEQFRAEVSMRTSPSGSGFKCQTAHTDREEESNAFDLVYLNLVDLHSLAQGKVREIRFAKSQARRHRSVPNRERP